MLRVLYLLFLSVSAAVLLPSCQPLQAQSDPFCGMPEQVDHALSQRICDMAQQVVADSGEVPIGLKVYELTKYEFRASFLYTHDDRHKDLSSESVGIHIFDAELSPAMYQAVIENLLKTTPRKISK